MSEKSKAILIVSLIISLLSGASLYYGIVQHNRSIDSMIKVSENDTHYILEAMKNATFQIGRWRIRHLLDANPQIVEAVATRNRKLLYELTLSHYEEYCCESKFHNIMHFHLPDNTTLLRMHRPDFFGDNLEDLRPIISTVNRSHELLFGFEIGRHGAFYRIVQPIFYNNTYVGALEFGISAYLIIEVLESETQMKSTAFVNERAWQNATHYRGDPVIKAGKFILTPHNKSLSAMLPKSFQFEKDTHPIITFDNLSYIVHSHQIFNDFQGKNLGGLIIFQDITQIIERKNSFIFKLTLFTTGLLFLAIMSLYISFGRIIGSLRENESKLSSIFRTAPTGIGVTVDRVFMDVNVRFCEMVGYSEKELLGKNARMVYPSQREFEEVGEEHLRQLEKLGTGTIETRLQHKDGTIIDVILKMTPQDLNNLSAGITFTFMDVTEIKNTEKKLRESEHKFREMANLLPQVVYEADLQGNLTFVNEQAYNLFGYSQEDVDKGLNFLQSLVPEDRDRAEENIKNILNGKPFENVEYTAIRKDGLTLPVMTYTSSIINDRKAVGLRGIIVDLSERKRMEKELLKVRKLESVGVLAGGIAHDFNNILAAILGNISLALTTTDPKDEIYELLAESEKASLRAKDLTQQLLTFAKGGEPVKKIAVIDEVVKDSADFVLRGSNVRCEFNFAEELWPVAIDTGQISQVIQNIVVNASQAMPNGGTITIDCLNYFLESSDLIPVRSGNYIKVVIKDQGIGIPSDMLDNIFDPYFTTKQIGSGLGLAITHSIIIKHDGYITVNSKPGQGATFTIYLPASQERPEPKPEAIAVAPVKGHGKIMIMDDEEMIRSLAERALSRSGYEVVLAADGNEAVQLYQKAKEAGAPIHLIIMDLTIPGGMGGKEAIKEIHKTDPEAKVIVSSGYSNDPVMADFGEYGFCGAMAKPFQMRELMEVVGKAVPS